MGTGLPSNGNNPPSPFEILFPADGQTGLGTTVTFKWKRSTDPDDDTITYDLYYCEDKNFGNTECITVQEIASLVNKVTIYANLGLYGLFLFGVAIVGGIKGRERIGVVIAIIMVAGMLLVSCGGGNEGGGESLTTPPADADEVSHTVSGLNHNTTYYWKVVTNDGNGGKVESETRSFTTQ